MGLSSNSIIHFTKTSEVLKEILRDNFKIHFCVENVDIISYASPMVSFCDIPLSEVKEHIGKYGSYGIGLTKEWAQREKLNPVLYLNKGSAISKSYKRLYDSIITAENIADLTDNEKDMLNVLRYFKNYQADLVRGGEVIKDYRYSDEREWRFSPDYEDCNEIALSIDHFKTEKDREEQNAALSDLRLEFEPNDIKYIIIERESEISEFVEVLKKSKGNKYSYHDVERLMTRIITSEQIVTDL